MVGEPCACSWDWGRLWVRRSLERRDRGQRGIQGEESFQLEIHISYAFKNKGSRVFKVSNPATQNREQGSVEGRMGA